MSDRALIERSGMPLVTWTSEVTTVNDEIDRILAGDPRRIIVKGPAGVGRTYLAAILAGELRSRPDSSGYLIARAPTPEQFRGVSEGQYRVVVADDFLLNARGLDRTLSRAGDRVSWLLTVAEGSSSRLEGKSTVLRLPSLAAADNPDAVEVLATFFLSQYVSGLDKSLPESEVEHVFDQSARKLLPVLTWSNNLAMVAEFARRLFQDLEMRGVIADSLLQRPITSDEVTDLYREIRRLNVTSAADDPKPTVVVEGVSDKVWLEGAAALHQRICGDDLLAGIKITAANGAPDVLHLATKIFFNEAVPTLALLDGDSVAEKFYKAGEALPIKVVRVPRPHYLPPSPYGDEPEIEDLVEVKLLAQFYENHRDLCPETEVFRMGQLARLAPHKQKVPVANWCVANASPADFAELIKLLQTIRDQLLG